VETFGLTRAQLAALRFHAHLDLRQADLPSACHWLVATQDLEQVVPMAFDPRHWTLVATVPRPTDPHDNLLVYRKR
jgi:hypothetical protein